VAPLEPWEKVFINLGRRDNVGEIDYHLAEFSCVDCHGGKSDQFNNMEKAHTGLIKDPSEYHLLDGENNSCGGASNCHNAIVSEYKNSLHQQLWGEKRMVALRFGVDNFEACPTETQVGYSGECTSCHATCGDCHISIPNSAGQGFISSHRFRKTPDQSNNCTACHGSRIAHDFYGDAETGRKGDIHFEKFMDCLDCHTQAEMHTGITDTENTHRYNYDLAPSCTQGCHTDSVALEVRNIYHVQHFADLTCHVCHSQPTYNNCTGCHVKNEWQTDPVYQANNPVEDFKIGLNPLPGHSNAKYATLRHIPIAPDSYSNWGPVSANIPAYDTRETWKFTTPHNIRRFTALTDTTGGVGCMASCHPYQGSDNRDYFLFRNFIQSEWGNEVDANRNVVVDDDLPPLWR